MGVATTIGLDIAKSVFQVHGVDAADEVVVRGKLTRGRELAFFEKLPRCLVGVEACSSSHYWARELTARGHDVRLLPAQYVKPYLKQQKNEAADAEAICEAANRSTMRSADAQPPAHADIERIAGAFSEFGVLAPIGRNGVEQLLTVINDENDLRVPVDARVCLRMLEAQLKGVQEQILENDRRVMASARDRECSERARAHETGAVVDGFCWPTPAGAAGVRRAGHGAIIEQDAKGVLAALADRMAKAARS